MKMTKKPVGFGTKYHHNIRNLVGRVSTYRFSIREIEKELADALKPQFPRIEAILGQQFEEIRSLRQEIMTLQTSVKDLNSFRDEMRKLITGFLSSIPQVKNKKHIAGQVTENLLVKNLKAETEIKGLAAYSDGTIRYKSEVIPMRGQLNDLCRLFISQPGRLFTCDDIKDVIVNANRREMTTFSTISKYVSELHSLLKQCFGREVIFNHKKVGWRFKP